MASLSTGELWGAVAVADSHGEPLKYVRDNYNGYRLSGVKLHVTGIRHAGVIVVSITPRAGQNVDSFVIYTSDPGVKVSPKIWQGMGMNAQQAAPVRFEDVKIVPDQVIMRPEYAEAEALSPMSRTYTPHTLGFAALILGTLEGLEHQTALALRQAVPRGPRAPINWWFGRAHSLISGGKLLVENAALKMDSSLPESAVAGLEAKAYVADVAGEVADLLLQCGGTALYLSETKVARQFQLLFRDLRGLLLLGPRNTTPLGRIGNELLTDHTSLAERH